jgi:hypothetical protein
MGASEHVQRRLHCGRCGEVIGIYEPLVVLEDGAARQTSYAAEPGLIEMGEAVFHRACHEQLAKEGGAVQRASA